MIIAPGRYRHDEGPQYEVLGVARHSETEEGSIAYRALYGRRRLWIRAVAMFDETVVVDGRAQPRVEFIQDDTARTLPIAP